MPPYIKQDRRAKLNSPLAALITQLKSLNHEDLRDLDGDLNYVITKLLLEVYDLNNQPKYTKFNTILGILEAVKLELYRQRVALYEDEKIAENGDIV